MKRSHKLLVVFALANFLVQPNCGHSASAGCEEFFKNHQIKRDYFPTICYLKAEFGEGTNSSIARGELMRKLCKDPNFDPKKQAIQCTSKTAGQKIVWENFCKNKAKNPTLCTMMLDPSECGLDNKIKATGSNACDASNKLIEKICQQKNFDLSFANKITCEKIKQPEK